MKKSLSLLLAITMVFSMFASVAFAQEQQAQEALDTMAKFEKLKELGIMQGHADGSAGLDENMTRAQAAVVIVTLFGLDISNLPAAATFSDVLTDHWASPYVESAAAAGIINGRGNGTFDPNGNVTLQELAVLLVLGLNKSVGLEIDRNGTVSGNVKPWAQPYVATAVANGLLPAGLDYTKAATRAELVEAVYATNEANVRVESVEVLSSNSIAVKFSDSDEAVTYEFEEAFQPNVKTTVEVEYKGRTYEVTFVYEVTDPMVVDAKALNLIQVEVTFNNEEYDAKEAEDEENYVLEDEDGDEIEAKDVELNGTKAIVTFEEAVDNKSTWTLTVDKNVTGTEAQFDIDFLDNTIPEVEEAAVIGKSTIKVKFSEPIDFGDLDEDNYVTDNDLVDAFDVDVVSVRDVHVLKNGKEVNLILSGDIDDEESVELKVKGDLQDYAGHRVIPVTLELEVNPDDEAPQVVGFKNASPSEVTLIFNKDITVEDADEENFYHTSSKNIVQEQPKANGNELKLVFVAEGQDEDDDNVYPLPEGNAYIFIAEEAISDLWGNLNEDEIRFQITVEEDTVKPRVKEVEVKDDGKIIEVKFSEDVKAKRTDFTLLDANGKKLDEIRGIDPDEAYAKTIKLELRSADLSGGHSLVIENVRDRSGNKIDKVTIDIDMDGKRPVISEFKATFYDWNTTNQLIVVDFGQKMATSGQYSVLDTGKYVLKKYEYNNGAYNNLVATYELDDEDYEVKTKARDNNRSVEIRIPFKDAQDHIDIVRDKITVNGEERDKYAYVLEIARVANAAGRTSAELQGEVNVVFERNIAMSKAEAKETNLIEITFTDVLQYINLNDFEIYKGSGSNAAKFGNLKDLASSSSTSINKNNQSVLTVTLKKGKELDYDVNGWEVRTVDQEKIRSENQYRVKLSAVDVALEDKIKPEVDEDVDGANYSFAGITGWKDGFARVDENTIAIAVTESVYNNNTIVGSASNDFVIWLEGYDGFKRVDPRDYEVSVDDVVDENNNKVRGIIYITIKNNDRVRNILVKDPDSIPDSGENEKFLETIAKSQIDVSSNGDPQYIKDDNGNKLKKFDRVTIKQLN